MNGIASLIGYLLVAAIVLFVLVVILVRRARRAERRDFVRSNYTNKRPWWAGR